MINLFAINTQNKLTVEYFNSLIRDIEESNVNNNNNKFFQVLRNTKKYR